MGEWLHGTELPAETSPCSLTDVLVLGNFYCNEVNVLKVTIVVMTHSIIQQLLTVF